MIILKFKRHIVTAGFQILLCNLVLTQSVINYAVDGKTIVSQSFLLKPVEPIAAALGNSKISTPSSTATVFSNPSGLLFNDEIVKGININYLPLTNNNKINDVYTISIGGFYRTNAYNLFGASLRYANFGSINLISENLDAFGISHPFDISADVFYAIKVSQKLSLSATIRYIHNNISNWSAINNNNVDVVSGNSFASDINLTYCKPFYKSDDNIKLMLSLSNLGANLGSRYTYTFQPYLPANLGLGMSYKKIINPSAELTIVAEANKLLVPILYVDSSNGKQSEEYNTQYIFKSYFTSFSDNRNGLMGELSELYYSLGAQFLLQQKIYFRAGVFKDATTLTDVTSLTLGLGLRFYNNYECNIAFNTYLTNNNLLLKSLQNNSFRLGFTYQIFGNFFDAERARIKGFLYK